MGEIVIAYSFVDHEGIDYKDMFGVVESADDASDQLFGDIHELRRCRERWEKGCGIGEIEARIKGAD